MDPRFTDHLVYHRPATEGHILGRLYFFRHAY